MSPQKSKTVGIVTDRVAWNMAATFVVCSKCGKVKETKGIDQIPKGWQRSEPNLYCTNCADTDVLDVGTVGDVLEEEVTYPAEDTLDEDEGYCEVGDGPCKGTESVELRRIELRSRASQTRVFPLDRQPRSWTRRESDPHLRRAIPACSHCHHAPSGGPEGDRTLLLR